MSGWGDEVTHVYLATKKYTEHYGDCDDTEVIGIFQSMESALKAFEKLSWFDKAVQEESGVYEYFAGNYSVTFEVKLVEVLP